MGDVVAMVMVHICVLYLRSRFFLNKAIYDIEKCPWKGPRILAWFWVKFPEHFMFIYCNFLSATHGAAYDRQLIMADIPMIVFLYRR